MMPRQKGNNGGSGHHHHPSQGGRGYEPSNPSGLGNIPISFRGIPDGEPTLSTRSQLDQTTLQLNELNIRNIDPEVRSIVDYSTQSAVYPHEPETGAYGPARAVGSLFLYNRTSGNFGFVVLNRVGVEHWLYLICPTETQVQLSDSYLLFNDNGAIFCVWFYSAADASRIFKFLLSLGCSDGKPSRNAAVSLSSLFSPQSQEQKHTNGGGQMLMDWLKSAQGSKVDTQTQQTESQLPSSTIFHPKPLNPTTSTSSIPTVLDQLVNVLKGGEGGRVSDSGTSPAHQANVMQTVEQIEAQSGAEASKPEAQGFLSEMKQIEAQLKLTLKISESGPKSGRLVQRMGTGGNITSAAPTKSHDYSDLSRCLHDAILHALPPPKDLNHRISESGLPISRHEFERSLHQLIGNKDFVDRIYESYVMSRGQSY